jgi:hypothetical protein
MILEHGYEERVCGGAEIEINPSINVIELL